MPRLTIHSAVWILTLLFHLTVTENKTCLENVRFLDPREDRLTHDSSDNYWKQRPSRGNESIETIRSKFPDKILQIRATRNIDLEKEKKYKNTEDRRTLMDFNGPVIMEDLDDTTDQDVSSHIRVKRNEPIVHRRSSRSILVDSFPWNFRCNTDVISVFRDSTFEGSHSDRENRSGIVMDIVTSRSRRKRGILPKSRYRRKRVKGNVEHPKHHAEIRNGKKKHDALKFSHQPAKKKMNNPSSKERSKNSREIGMPARTIDEPRIEKRESGNSELNTNIDIANDVEKAGDLISQKENVSLINNRSFAEQQRENTIMLPFVHTGRAELRVRIEKLPANESSFISPSHWTDYSVETSPYSTTLPKYNASDEIFNVNVTNLELTSNADSVGRKKANNLTLEITLKKLDDGNNASILEINDPESTSFYNMESYPVRSNVPEIGDQNVESGKYDRTNEISARFSDEKSRAKRNHEIMSKRYLRSDKNAKGSRHFEDAEQGTSIEDTKRGKTKHRRTRGNRTVRSIEEIKDLAEKLIIKINELEVYVSNRNETLHARDSCLGKNDRVVEEEPRSSLEKKDVSSSTSKIAKNINIHRRFAKEAVLAGKRASQMRSSGSRFARGEYQTRRRSRRKWGRWMDWSSCSVTCGKGRQIRWRHCLHDCNDAETEMEEKACQLPACPPSKFLGIF